MCALPATDSFTNTNGTALSTHSASWTIQIGTYVIQGNAAATNTSGSDSFASWNADVFNNDQYSQGTILTVTAGEYAGVAVRMASGTTHTSYHYYSESGASYFQKVIIGTYTQFGSTGGGFASNDLVRLEANGTTITPKKNGATDSGVGGAVTDSSIASGRAGIGGFGVATATDTRIDTWEGGNLGGAVAPIGRLRQYMQAVNRAATY